MKRRIKFGLAGIVGATCIVCTFLWFDSRGRDRPPSKNGDTFSEQSAEHIFGNSWFQNEENEEPTALILEGPDGEDDGTSIDQEESSQAVLDHVKSGIETAPVEDLPRVEAESEATDETYPLEKASN